MSVHNPWGGGTAQRKPEPDSAAVMAGGDRLAQRILMEQVASAFATLRGSVLAEAPLAWGLAALYYGWSRDARVGWWMGVHLVPLLRYPVLAAYFRDAEVHRRSRFWARTHAQEMLITSLAWAAMPWILVIPGAPVWDALLVMVLIGLATAGVSSLAPLWPSVLAFMLPMEAGLVASLLWRGDTARYFMAGCCVLYLLATLQFARQQNRLLTGALRARFEKEALAEQLAQQMALTLRAVAEKNRFFAAASHDLRQPLHAIALFGAVLERELLGRSALQHAQRMMGGVRALSGLLDTLLDVSKLDAGVVVPRRAGVAVNDLLRDMNQVFASCADERGLVLRLRASPLWVETDAALMRRLLGNLVDNALKYTRHGGVLVAARARGKRVWIEVWDTGIGMATQHLDQVFEEFFQVDNPGRDRSQGLGLGLSIVRSLSALLDHPVAVNSRLGRGSCFRVVLPRYPAPELPTGAGPPRGDAPRGVEAAQTGLTQSRAPRLARLDCRVLVIDDEHDITVAMATVLQASGARCEVAHDEHGAWVAFGGARRRGECFDVVVCDWRLPQGSDGLTLALRLRDSQRPAPAILLITGETSPEQLQRVRASGVPVLFKPVDALTLVDAVARLVSGGDGANP